MDEQSESPDERVILGDAAEIRVGFDYLWEIIGRTHVGVYRPFAGFNFERDFLVSEKSIEYIAVEEIMAINRHKIC